jgi:TolB-like protein
MAFSADDASMHESPLSSEMPGDAAVLPSDPSVAVLPLRNCTGRASDEPLCAGITGDIIHSLTRRPIRSSGR